MAGDMRIVGTDPAPTLLVARKIRDKIIQELEPTKRADGLFNHKEYTYAVQITVA